MDVVLGMDFGGTKIALAICGLDGRCLAQQVLVTNPDTGGDAVLERGISASRALLALSGDHHDLVSVGVSTIGIPREDRVELAPAIPGWEHVGLARTVTTAFGVPVRVVTDVKAAATAEARWGSLSGSDPAIYLNLGTGLAAAILVGIVWRRGLSLPVRAAVLLAAIPVATPIVMFYDLMLTGVAIAWLVQAGRTSGFAPWTRTLLAVAFVLPLLSGNLGGVDQWLIAPAAATLVVVLAACAAWRECKLRRPVALVMPSPSPASVA